MNIFFFFFIIIIIIALVQIECILQKLRITIKIQ